MEYYMRLIEFAVVTTFTLGVLTGLGIDSYRVLYKSGARHEYKSHV